jgi:hypothetical protein
MDDYEAVKAHFSTNNLDYFSFFPKALKPVKAVIHTSLPITLQRASQTGW